MKEGWEYKKLGEVASIKSGYTPSSSDLMDCGNIPYFKVGDMNNVGNEKYLQYSSSYVNDTFKSFPKGSIVFPKNGAAIATNKKRILKQLSVVDLNTAVLIPTQKENVEFLYYWISNIDFRDITRRGTVPTLDTKTLMKLDVPHPPLAEQERIVAELDLLSSIIDKKKAQLKELDQLAQSIFYDMFGGILEDTPSHFLKDIASYYIGLTYKPTDVSEEGTIVLRSSNIQNNKLDFNDVVRVNVNINDNKIVHDGDILMCARNGSARLVGKVARIKDISEKMSFGAFMTIIRSEYNDFLFNFFLSDYFRCQLTTSKTATINQITSRMLDNIKINIPPFPLQQEFASKIEAIERQKSLIQQSIVETQTLFDSRMDYWFG